MARENFGLMGYDSYHFAVNDLEQGSILLDGMSQW